MSSPTDKDEVDSGQGAGTFPATEWNLVLSASREGSAEGGTALEALCRQYWYPVYAHVRHVGYGVEEAKDLTQEFFARLLAHHSLAAADPARGRFRSFIRASLRNFLANEWDKSHTTKRGGGRPCLSMDDLDAEERYAIELSHEASPEVAYDRAWACMIIELVLRRMREDYVRGGKGEQFQILERYLDGGEEDLSCVALAQRLGLTESAAKSAAYRFRQRFAMMLRGEIARTVPRREDIDEEIRQLAAALAGG
ncbi:MAG TPA: sigma-70 family RNA polymerase sigma factor [Candidatus Paceibacterota bacterium]|nr:sigma-70 family RNA polymerase sigma factor [Candidatus Paceibacterota bacterium]HRZ57071.1 sigma-70 family RNA polymerase sigma factor [Candidatus Paceibacterota bacterium]